MTDVFGNSISANGVLTPLSSASLPRDLLKVHPIMSLMRSAESQERGEMDVERAQWLNQLCECFIRAGEPACAPTYILLLTSHKTRLSGSSSPPPVHRPPSRARGGNGGATEIPWDQPMECRRGPCARLFGRRGLSTRRTGAPRCQVFHG